MKILMVCTENLPVPPVLGGAIQTYISGSLPYLSKSHDITIMGINDPSLPDEETIDGVNYIRVPGRVLELYRDGVVRYIESNHFDLIHIFNRPRLVLPIRKVAPKSKITLSMHNDMFNFGKIDDYEANLVIEEVSSIVTVSDYVGNVIKELYPQSASKIRTIYSGVDTNRFLPGTDPKMIATRNSLRQEFGLENKTVLLFAGRLSENKGVDRLIRALPQLSNSFENLALVIVGSNWFSQNNVTDYVAYVRAISKKQQVPVITTGFVSPFEMQNWFAVADLFVCTSLWQEPLARVHYEAMAAGLPIVTTARGGNAEVINSGENGFIVENPEDPSEFATKITQILSNKSLMNSMGKKGRALANEKYLFSRVANELLEVWQQSEFSSTITTEQLESYESKLVFRTAEPKKVVINTDQMTQADSNKDSVKVTENKTKIEKKQVEEVLVTVEREKVVKVKQENVMVGQNSNSNMPRKLKPLRKVTEKATSTRMMITQENVQESRAQESKTQVIRGNNGQAKLGNIRRLTERY